jgi:hypothetical protein
MADRSRVTVTVLTHMAFELRTVSAISAQLLVTPHVILFPGRSRICGAPNIILLILWHPST